MGLRVEVKLPKTEKERNIIEMIIGNRNSDKKVPMTIDMFINGYQLSNGYRFKRFEIASKKINVN